METILVSACLLGVCCRYDDGGKDCPALTRLMGAYQLIPVCPEQLGGLSTPRPPAEIVGERVMNKAGEDVTGAFERGAQETLRLARLYGAQTAILKERSPSCGAAQVYDGSFSGVLRDGKGITATLLIETGIRVLGESEIGRLQG